MAASDPYLGSVSMWAPNFAPRGWALCAGQLLPVSQNSALFSLLGTAYGGDGRVTFALPDMRGRVPRGAGDGPGLSPVRLGEAAGIETVTLQILEIPTHTHDPQITWPTFSAQVKPNAFSGRGGTATNDPIGSFHAPAPTGTNIYNTNSSGVLGETPATILEDTPGRLDIFPTGDFRAHENRMPFLGINYIIALQGISPSRN